jgi:uncharacterized membrane protein YbhN (UPF0104 family)
MRFWARWRLVVLAILVPIAAVVLWRFPWVPAADAVAKADLALLTIALVANLVAIFAKGSAWHLLLNPVARHRYLAAQEANIVGAAVNNVSISVVGEVERVRYLATAERLPTATVAVSVVWARAIEGAALALVLAAGSLVLDFPFAVRVAQGAAAGTILVLLTLAWIGRAKPPPERWPRALRELAASFGEIGSPRRLVAPLALGVVNWAGEWATLYFTLLAVHAHVSPGATLTALLAINVAGGARLLPANVGILQIALAAALLPLRVSSQHVLAAGFLFQFLQVMPVLFLALVVVLRRPLRQARATG